MHFFCTCKWNGSCISRWPSQKGEVGQKFIAQAFAFLQAILTSFLWGISIVEDAAYYTKEIPECMSNPIIKLIGKAMEPGILNKLNEILYYVALFKSAFLPFIRMSQSDIQWNSNGNQINQLRPSMMLVCDF